ncbi:MAG: O-antigen ligase family protein [Verrucomicrobia bacterium]|nr:O-antigen ligase family protein [Verrucomicrobiota bacterium]
MTASANESQQQLSSIPDRHVFFSRYNLPVPRFEFFLAFFLASLPFQLSLWQLFIEFSKHLYPAINTFPWCYVKIIIVFTTDALFVVALLAMLFSNKIPWRRCFWDGPAKYLLLLTGTFLVSLIFAKTPSFPVQYVKLFQQAMPFLLFCLIPYCFNASSFRPFLRGAFISLFAVGIIQSVIAIFQYFLQDSLGLSFLGEKILNSAFESTRGELSIFDSIFPTGKSYPWINRASGTVIHSNILGSFLFFTIMISYALYLEFRSKKFHAVILSGIFLQITALFLTFSRSGLTATFIGTVLWLWWTRRQLKLDESKDNAAPSEETNPGSASTGRTKALRPLVLTVIISVISCITIFYPAFNDRGFLNENDTVQGSTKERLVNFRVAMGMISDHPLLGVGFDTFQLVKSRYNPTSYSLDMQAPVHNSYLIIAAETGFLGLGIYLLFILSVIRRALKAPFNVLHASLLISFLGFLYLNCLDFGFLLVNNLTFYYFAVAALLVVPSMLANKKSP